MKFGNKTEKKIVTGSCIATIVIVLGITMSQGTVKKKDDTYTSKLEDIQATVKISKSDYEIIKQRKNKGKETLLVLQNKKFTKAELAALTNELRKDSNEELEIYLFDDAKDAKDFEYEDSQIQTLIKSKNSNTIEVLNYNIVENEIESEPRNYNIESVEKGEDSTKIEIATEKVENPQKALAQIKFLGDSVRESKSDEDLGDLKITTYYNDEKTKGWKYTSENKKLVMHSEIITL